MLIQTHPYAYAVRTLYSCILLLAVSTQWGCKGGTTVPIASPQQSDYISPYFWSDTLRPKQIMIVGDLQPTTWVEKRFLGRPQNDSVRTAIIKAAVSNHPEMLLLLGDQVGEGENDKDWIAFDSLMKPVCANHIPVYAIVGNHDYGFLTSKGIQHCTLRFPYSTTLPQIVRLGDSVVMLIVDSNIGVLPSELQEYQAERYRTALRTLDADSSIRAVIVASHHPPYTNSTLPIDRRVRETFAPPFLEARKTILFLSGHIHAYERLEIEGKTFIVSGGGGGPRRDVNTSEDRAIKTDQYRKGEYRPFHYIDLTIRPEGIRGEVEMLVNGKFRLGDGFSIRWPK